MNFMTVWTRPYKKHLYLSSEKMTVYYNKNFWKLNTGLPQTYTSYNYFKISGYLKLVWNFLKFLINSGCQKVFCKVQANLINIS